MLEAAILDNTERLLASGPYFGSVPKWTIMHMEAASGSKYAYGLYNQNMPRIYNEVLDIILFRGVNNYLYRLIPENCFTGANTVVQDTTLLVHQLAIEPSSGRTWAVVNNSSGADGLYLRAASVGTPAWTKVIGATNGASLAIWKKSNGELWYNDATAGNWYQLSNGTAGGAQTSAPASLYTTWVPLYESQWNIDCFYGVSSPTVCPLCFDGQPAYYKLVTGGSYNAESWANHAAIYINSAAPSGATLKTLLPSEVLAAARFSTQTTTLGSYSKTFRLNETYSLIAMVTNLSDVVAINATTNYNRILSFDSGKTRVALALLNKSTWACHYIGSFVVPYFCESLSQPANEPPAAAYLLAARLKNGAIELCFSGTLARDNTTDYAGLLWASIPLNKLDF